jgi:hypothetical protein
VQGFFIGATGFNTMNETSQGEPESVDAQYGGKWIAWDDQGVKIVASGSTLQEVREKARVAGVKLPALEFVPRSDRAFVGGV